MRALVTGGAGFIGSYVVEELIHRGFEVHILDNMSSGQLKNVPEQAELHIADIRDEETVALIERIAPNYVFHHAAQVDVQKSLRHPSHDTSVNVLGTVHVLEACARVKGSKIIFASTSAVYGNLERSLIDEDDPTFPISYYGLSKLTAEHYIRLFASVYEIPYTILRYANVYGARQTAKGEGGVVALFMDRIRQGEPLVIHGDGEQTRDFIYVSDIVQANMAAMQNGTGETIQVSTGTPVSINALADCLGAVHGSPLTVVHQGARLGDIRHSCLGNQKAESRLGWTPQYCVQRGLMETYRNVLRT